MRFRATAIVGSSKVNIGLEGMGGTIAEQVHGNLGRELVRLANLQLETEEEEAAVWSERERRRFGRATP